MEDPGVREYERARSLLSSEQNVPLHGISAETAARLQSSGFFADARQVWTRKRLIQQVRRLFEQAGVIEMSLSDFARCYEHTSGGCSLGRLARLPAATQGVVAIRGHSIRLAMSHKRRLTTGRATPALGRPPIAATTAHITAPAVVSSRAIADALVAVLGRAGPRGLPQSELPRAVGAHIAPGVVISNDILRKHTHAAHWSLFLQRMRGMVSISGQFVTLKGACEPPGVAAENPTVLGADSAGDPASVRAGPHRRVSVPGDEDLAHWRSLVPPTVLCELDAALVAAGVGNESLVEVTFAAGHRPILTHRAVATNTMIHTSLRSPVDQLAVLHTVSALTALWLPARATSDGCAAGDVVDARSDTGSELHCDHEGAHRRVLAAFTKDNRIGVPGTLHRVSGIRNVRATMDLVHELPYSGFTLRVGRMLYGASTPTIPAYVLEPALRERSSVLVIGAPCTGKTTMLRDLCRRAAAAGLKVVVVDHNSELTGCGTGLEDVLGSVIVLPTMQREEQHTAMLEAVANHSPDVVVIDEIGRHQEVSAACDIARRGVALLASVHATSLRELSSNPTLSRLVGATLSVAVGDGTAEMLHRALQPCGQLDVGDVVAQKAQIVRREPPAFHIGVELTRGTSTATLHADLAQATDRLLQFKCSTPVPSPMRPPLTM